MQFYLKLVGVTYISQGRTWPKESILVNCCLSMQNNGKNIVTTKGNQMLMTALKGTQESQLKVQKHGHAITRRLEAVNN